MTRRLLEHWLQPEEAGSALACLATTYTFDADFFSQDCLARFLGISHAYGETDRPADIALMLEEEDLLSEARVCVLADRSASPEARNLRWDVLPVTVPGGLLHAKTAVLLWERGMRILVGSANLTRAGYRRQAEVMAAFEIHEGSDVAEPFALELLGEIRQLVDLAPGNADRDGPKQRAHGIIDQAEERVRDLGLPRQASRSLQLAVASASPGSSPLARLDDVWRGSPPQWVTAMSPFWDTGSSPPAIEAIVSRLAGRASPGEQREARFIVPVDRHEAATIVRAPRAILENVPASIATSVARFAPPPDDGRLLHAKVLVYETDQWLAAMIGSSNHTEAGFGLHPSRGHRELNVWFGCRADSREAKALRKLVQWSEDLEVDDASWEPEPDEDEITPPKVPLGFVNFEIKGSSPAEVALELDATELPSAWRITTPDGEAVLDSGEWERSGRGSVVCRQLESAVIPSFVTVTWQTPDGEISAAFPLNVAKLQMLPPPDELRDLPADVLLSVLASTRPLRLALESALRRRESKSGSASSPETDPLRRFDNSGLILHRVRRVSHALWGLGQRLSRPAHSIEGLEWRLTGSVSPCALAEAIVRETRDGGLRATEARFLLAELALTVGTVNWATVRGVLDPRAVGSLVDHVMTRIESSAGELDHADDEEGLAEYAAAAFTRARACAGS